MISDRIDIRHRPGCEVVCDDNPYPQEARDVRTQCSTVFLFPPSYLQVNVRLALNVYQLVLVMTVSELARRLKLSWKLVEVIDQHYLERGYENPTYAQCIFLRTMTRIQLT